MLQAPQQHRSSSTAAADGRKSRPPGNLKCIINRARALFQSCFPFYVPNTVSL